MKKLLLGIITLVVLFGISGCIQPQPQYKTFWKKDGVTYNEAININAECIYQVGMQKIKSAPEKQELKNSCMQRQGFRWDKYLKNN